MYILKSAVERENRADALIDAEEIARTVTAKKVTVGVEVREFGGIVVKERFYTGVVAASGKAPAA